MLSSQKKILVVDDDAILVKTISLKLQGAGYQGLTAMDGTSAITTAREHFLDLILLDLNFPPEVDGLPWDGFRILEWFRRLENLKKIPVIIISGTEDREAKLRATQMGAVAFLQKPLDHEHMLQVIRATLGLPISHSETSPASGSK